MNNFEINDETAIDLLIFWVGGADGLINFELCCEINHILEDLHYSPQNYQHTLNYLNGLRTKNIDNLIEKAILHVKKYDEETKRQSIDLLQNIAQVNRRKSKYKHQRLNQLKEAFNI